MANDLNQCNFIGRLGQDIELRYTTESKAIANFSLAVGWKSKDKEGVEWVRCVAFGKLAEIMGQYLSKGSKIFVSGSMRTRKWQDRSGSDQYTTEVVVSDMQMLDGKPEGQQGGGYNQQQSQPQRTPPAPPAGPGPRDPRGGGYQQLQRQASPQQPKSEPPEFDDDLPF